MSCEVKNLFELENCLKKADSGSFLSAFKSVISTGQEKKQTLTANPGLTIYSPKSPQNINSKKSILIVIHELSRTGAPVVAVDTAKTLIKNGYFVTVVTMRRGPLLKELLDLGVPVVFDRQLALSYDMPAILDSPHIHLYIDTFIAAFSRTIIITAVYHNLIRHYVQHLVSPQSIIWWLHEGTATYDIMGHLMPRPLNSNIKVYVGGKYALDQLKNYHLPYHAQVFNYGVTDVFQPTAKPSGADNSVTKKHTNSSSIKFLLPGSIGARKGQKLLLEAIRTLPQDYLKKSEFIFIGDVVSEGDIEGKNIKSELISTVHSFPNITYITSVTREELFAFYNKIDVLVLPSLDDPMPVVATEALMLEKVVLCSDTTGTSYYLKNGQNGFVFKTGDVDALRSQIIAIIDKKSLLPKIGQAGRQVYLQNFDMPIFESSLLNIIEEAK